MFLAASFIIAKKWKQSMSVKRGMDKQTGVFTQRNATQQTQNPALDTSNNMDESHKLYAKWKKQTQKIM